MSRAANAFSMACVFLLWGAVAHAQETESVKDRADALHDELSGKPKAEEQPAPPVAPAQPTPPAPAPAAPQPYSQQPYAQPYTTSAPHGSETHDGFFLRMSLGFGYGQVEVVDPPPGGKFFGGASQFDFEIGGAVSENLIVYGKLIGNSVQGPKFEVEGSEMETDDNLSVGTSGIGAGVSYYFMPVNLFISGSLLFTLVQIEFLGERRATNKFGPGIDVAMGKEWWVSDNWGLGIVGRIYLGSAEDEHPFFGTSKWRMAGGAVAFSATFN